MKVILAVNAHLSRQASHGPGKVGYSIARELHQRGQLGKVICYSAHKSVDLPRECLLEALDNRLKRKSMELLNRAGRAMPAIPARRFEERFFDRFATRHFDPSLGDTLVCTKPINPDLLVAAKTAGLNTALATSILHPRFNLEMVRKEQRRLGVSAPSVYTDENRVMHIEQALATVDRIITTNSFYKDNYSQYGVAAEKFVYPEPQRPHEGVDTSRFSPEENTLIKTGPFRVLHVSNMTLIKGVQYLIEAWKRIQDDIQGELVLFGPMDSNVRQLVRNCKARHLRLAGPGTPLAEYRQASVFISPSVSDAGPNTVFEAMACGVPAIVSNHCGISQFISSGKNGFVYPYDDVEQLTDLILECYRNRGKRIELAQAALETARGYPLGNYAAEFVATLEKAFPFGQQATPVRGGIAPLRGTECRAS